MRVSARREAWLLIVFFFFAASAAGQQYTFTYYAGSPGGPGVIDDTSTAARFAAPQGIKRDPAGNLYIADTMAHSIRVVSAAGVVSTFVGRRDDVVTADGARADARFYRPRALTRDGSGNLYVVTDTEVRKITPLGVVSTLFTGLSNAKGIAFDATTNSVFVTNSDHTVRKVTLAGDMTIFAGTSGTPGADNGTGSDIHFLNPTGIAVDSLGYIYVADGNHIIRKITPAGVSSTLAGAAGLPGHVNLSGTSARFNNPRGLAVDAAGYVYVADSANNAVRKITPLGNVSTIAGGTEGYLDAMSTSAKFNLPAGVDVDASSNVYVVEEENHTVRRIAADGTVTTIAGLGIIDGFVQGPITTARFDSPNGMVFDSGGNMFVADQFNNDVRKITPGSPATVSLFAGGTIGGADGLGGAAQFRFPNGITADGANNIWVADSSNHTIRKITTSGDVTTFAGTAQQSGTTNATGAAARFNFPGGLAIDSVASVFVADTRNHAIRKITSPGQVVTTFAGLAGTSGALDHATGTSARFNEPWDIVRDPNTGNFYVADYFNHAIRKITAAAAVSTFAGALGVSALPLDGTGTDARFYQPKSVSIDGSSNVYVIDNLLVRKITPGAVVTTIAGNIDYSIGSEDGTGSVARFASPTRVYAQADGTLFVSDFLTQSIRRGGSALTVYATIDSATGAIDTTRTLSSANHFLGVSYTWRIVRRPAGSTASLSSTTARTVTFTPDVPDLYVFRQTATSFIGQMSITDVSLLASCSALTVSPSSLPNPLIGTSYSQSLSGSGGMSGPFDFTISSGDLPPGLTLSSSGALSGTPTATGDYTFTVVATGARGCSGVRIYTLTVGTLPPPTGLVAAYNGSGVDMTWNPVPGASSYRIYRKSSYASAYSEIGTSGTASFTDPSPGSAVVLYRVRALDASLVASGDSNYDLAISYLTPPLVAGSSPVYASQIDVLRFVVDKALEMGGQPVTPYTDPSLPGVIIKASHVTELRTRMNQARTALGYTALSFTDPSLAGVPVKVIHWTEVWDGLR